MGALHPGGRALESVVLIGFMGSGKTTLGQRLSERLGWSFVDLDARVSESQRLSIRDIFARNGEAGFRALELETLRAHVASQPRRCVTATGGGIVETPDAHALLAQLGTVVWLRADPSVCVERLGASAVERPLLDAASAGVKRYARREALYARVAQHVVDTHPATVESCLERLVQLVRASSA